MPQNSRPRSDGPSQPEDGRQSALRRPVSGMLYRFFYLFSLLPPVLLRLLSLLVYWVLSTVMRYRYSVIFQNLSRSFPEKPAAEIRKIVRQYYRHFSNLFREILESASLSENEMLHRVRVVNPELLNRYQQRGRSVIIMLGHQGNWEYLNIVPKYFSFDMYALYKPLSNVYFDDLIKRFRSRFGMKLLPMTQAARFMLTHRDRPQAYFFIADQSPAPGSRCCIDFLNQRTLMFEGAEKLAGSIGAVVLYAEFRRSGEGWDLAFRLITEDPSATSPFEITRTFGKYLETSIQERPSDWLWSHRRWKHTPAEVA
ncbi:MAG: lysophospholipid acyltransferase family protein [Siphonobacter aquaeclarae]|nr:lysophospholipid acyltransferase family protein [Siphonobacter aquaeclarae]